MPEETRAPILPAHIDDTVRAIARLHAEHQGEATTSQRLAERLTAGAGRPLSLMLLTVLMVGWMAVNLAVGALGHKPWDEPPFAWLQGATGVAALYMTILILVTQRREDQLASHREQLTLELGILSEQKAAKIIELLECQSALKVDPLSASNIDPLTAIYGGSGRPAERVRVAQPGGRGGVLLRLRRGS